MRRAIFIIVYRPFAAGGATIIVSHFLAEFFRLKTCFTQLVQQVEMMLVNLGSLGQFLMLEVMVDTLNGYGGLTDCGGEQVRANNIARHEVTRFAGYLIVLVGIDKATFVTKGFHTGHIATLTNRGNNQIGFNIKFRTFFDRLTVFLKFNATQCDSSTVSVFNNFDRIQLAANFDTFA